MHLVFVVCAAVGTTVLVLQFLMALVGLGGDALGVDVPHDVGHDLGGADHDFDAARAHGDGLGGAGPMMVLPASMPKPTPRSSIDAGQAAARFDVVVPGALAADDRRGPGVLRSGRSGRPIRRVYEFYLVADRHCRRPGRHVCRLRPAPQHALLAGRRHRTHPTHRGQQATVYLRIPAQQSGTGKIQINIQNRTMEYLATTLGDAIPSGTTVVVTKVLGAETVQVQAVVHPPRRMMHRPSPVDSL